MYFASAPPGNRFRNTKLSIPGSPGRGGERRGDRVDVMYPGERSRCTAGRDVRPPREYPPAAPQAGGRRSGDGGSSRRALSPRRRRPGTRPWLPLLVPGAYAATSPGVRRRAPPRTTPVPYRGRRHRYDHGDTGTGGVRVRRRDVRRAPRALTSSTGARCTGTPRCSRGARGMYRGYRGAPREVRPGAAGERDAVGGGSNASPGNVPLPGEPCTRSLDPERASPGSGTAVPGAYLDVETGLPG